MTDAEYGHLTVDNYLTMKAPDQQNYIDIQTIMGMGGPILQISQSLMTKSDTIIYGHLTCSTDPAKSTGGGAVVIGHGWTAPTDYPAIVVTDYPQGGGPYNTLWLKYSTGQPSSLQNLAWGNLELGNLTANGLVQAKGGTSDGPGFWFSSYGPASGYFGGALGIGFNLGGQIVLNSKNGVVTANQGNLVNILDDGYGNMMVTSVAAYWFYDPYMGYFDALDDLALVKKYTAKTITVKDVETTVIDPESLPFLQADSRPQYFDLGKTNGFLLGCIKALVSRVEALENQLKSNQTAA